MNGIRNVLVLVLLASGTVTCCSLSWALVAGAVAAEQARVTLVQAGDVLQDVDAGVAEARLSQAAVAHRVLDAGGVLDEVADEQKQVRDVTRGARVTVDEVGQASIDQRHFWNAEMPALTGDVAATLRQSRVAIQSVSPVMVQAQATLAGFGPVQAEAARVERDVDARIASAQVTAMLDAGAKAAPQIAQAAANANAASAELDGEVHGLLHPKWPAKVWRKVRHPRLGEK